MQWKNKMLLEKIYPNLYYRVDLYEEGWVWKIVNNSCGDSEAGEDLARGKQ